MKSILMSMNPHWCNEILLPPYKKDVEVRKNKPTLEVPFKVYIYCTKNNLKNKYVFYAGGGSNNGYVIGEFVCDRIIKFANEPYDPAFDETAYRSCLTPELLFAYLGNRAYSYGWHITSPKLYDKPKPLSDFTPLLFKQGKYIKKAPQSWCYIWEETK